MSIKKKILEKCLRFIKKKKLPKQLAIVLLIVSLLTIYFLEFSYKLFEKVCFRRKVIASTFLVTILAFISITYFFYPAIQSKNVLADTVSQEEIQETDTEREGAVKGTSESIISAVPLSQVSPIAMPNTSIEGKNPYFIRVNRQQNSVTVYTYDDAGEYTVPIKAMICSTGSENTPLGKFKISQKYEFQKLLYDVYGQYAVRINGPILFHSTSYTQSEKDTLISEEYNNLGEGVSHGCIRLMVVDAKWIYDNCESGTEVEVYDSEDPGPLGKPDSITIPADTKWDPTDPDPMNPWAALTPRFEGVVDRRIELGTAVNELAGIKAYDTCGNDITSQITVGGYVNIEEPGTYTITYMITDLLGRTVTKTATFTVIEDEN